MGGMGRNAVFSSLARFLVRAGTGALELFAPPRCRACGLPLWGHGNPFLCAGCVGKMRWIGSGACRICGYPAGEYAAWGGNGCARCRGRGADIRSLSGVAAVARYGGGARELVRALKFHGEQALAPAMGALMAERWLAAGLDRGAVDLVVPVALHPGRRRSRGFDQSALLAGEIAAGLGVEYGGGALRRVKATRPQALLRRAERLSTMRGVFAAGEAVRGRTVLLVDDVFTTGATMSAAGAACAESGAGKVYGIAFAR